MASQEPHNLHELRNAIGQLKEKYVTSFSSIRSSSDGSIQQGLVRALEGLGREEQARQEQRLYSKLDRLSVSLARLRRRLPSSERSEPQTELQLILEAIRAIIAHMPKLTLDEEAKGNGLHVSIASTFENCFVLDMELDGAGRLSACTKTVIESGLDEEMIDNPDEMVELIERGHFLALMAKLDAGCKWAELLDHCEEGRQEELGTLAAQARKLFVSAPELKTLSPLVAHTCFEGPSLCYMSRRSNPLFVSPLPPQSSTHFSPLLTSLSFTTNSDQAVSSLPLSTVSPARAAYSASNDFSLMWIGAVQASDPSTSSSFHYLLELQPPVLLPCSVVRQMCTPNPPPSSVSSSTTSALSSSSCLISPYYRLADQYRAAMLGEERIESHQPPRFFFGKELAFSFPEPPPGADRADGAERADTEQAVDIEQAVWLHRLAVSSLSPALLHIIPLLRQQVIFNQLYLSCFQISSPISPLSSLAVSSSKCLDVSVSVPSASSILLSTPHAVSGKPLQFHISIGPSSDAAGVADVSVELRPSPGDPAPCSNNYASKILRTSLSIPALIVYALRTVSADTSHSISPARHDQ